MTTLGEYEMTATNLRNQISKMHIDIELAEAVLLHVRGKISELALAKK